jgi:sterol desaturase/sphingolipid hydroxylase (fatty acid hydroxylase superfamily)
MLHDSAIRPRLGSAVWKKAAYARLSVAVLLASTLTFVVISNYAGWTANVVVNSVERRCVKGECHRAVLVEGRAQTLRVSDTSVVESGHIASVRATCTPACKLELTGSRPGADQPDRALLTLIYTHLFFPALPIVATVQNTLTGLAQLAWIFVLAQIVFPAVRRRPKILSYELWLDIIYVLQTQLLFLTAAGAAVGLSSAWLQRQTPVLFPTLAEWPLWIQVVLAVWVYDFVVYWRHRLEHQFFLLWPIHAVHHTTTKVDVFTTTRLHPLELMAGGILNMWVTAKFGVSPEAASIGFMLYLNHNYYVHTNVKLVYPGFLKYIFVSPFMHRWHHAREEQACNKNFGVVFAWNDWLFGTALHPKREPKAYGLDYPDGEVAHNSYLAHLVYPMQVLAVRLRRRKRRLLNAKTPETVPVNLSE